MARTLSVNMVNAMYAQETGEAVICLMTISHPSFGQTYYVSSDATTRVSTEPLVYKTVSNGIDYFYAPLQIKLPDDVEEQAPTTQFMLENVSRDIVARIRSVDTRQGRAKFNIKLVRASAPNTIEIEYPDFDIVNASFNANVVTLTAQIDVMTDEPYPAHTFDPSGFPSLHGLPP